MPGPNGRHQYLVLTCSDGAGSAELSHFGSRAACLGVVRACESSLSEGWRERDVLTESNARAWFAAARDAMAKCADDNGVEPRQVAATLLLAVVGRNAALFAQVGDGAIITSDGDKCGVVFWPDRGEYANETTFLTSDQWESSFRSRCTPRVDEVALLTDGLQPVALHNATQTAHAPFFLAMFAQLREVSDSSVFAVPLNAYLISEPLRKRTDDDLTLVLATRLSGKGAHA